MRAIVVDRPGGPEVLRQADIARPEPAGREVRVRLESIGVNYADVMCRLGVHQSMRQPPIVPGCEGAGIVEAVGLEVSRHRVGDRVGVYSPFGGAYAEALVVPEDYALPLPLGMGFDEAAAFTHLALTAQQALAGSGSLVPGMTVLVTAAAGGLGGMLTQLAPAYGLRVIAGVGSPAKVRLLRERGLQVVIDYSRQDLTEQVLAETDGIGVDIAIETVGGGVFDQAQASLAPLGRIVIAGAASGVTPRPDVGGLLARSARCSALNLSIVFARQPGRMHRAWDELVALYAAGTLRPRVSRRLPLAQAADAHRALEGRASVDKILLDPGIGAMASLGAVGTSFA
jgi:NADPH2:quinone reductase